MLTLPSSGAICSRSGTPLAITSLRGQLRPAGDRLAYQRGGRGLEDRAQRLRQSVVRAAVGRDRLIGAPRSDEPREHVVVDEGQVAGEHQPRGLRVRGLRRGDPGDGTDALVRIDDLRKARTHGLGALIRAHGHEDLLAMTREERMAPRELRPAVELERRLVAPHARARAAGQHEPVERCEGGCVVHVRGRWARFRSRRTTGRR